MTPTVSEFNFMMSTKFWHNQLAVSAMWLITGGDAHPSFGAEPRIIVWSGPGGDIEASRDYEVTVRSGDKSWNPFTYQSTTGPRSCSNERRTEMKIQIVHLLGALLFSVSFATEAAEASNDALYQNKSYA